jgi:ligand-binding sensor domain-containing protein
MTLPCLPTLRRAAARLALLGLAAGLATPGWAQRVKDAFEVGPSVYVRALTVEPRRGALWVGTSAGVHEVDLASGKLRNTFTRKEGLANEYVFAIGLDRQGHKWFGTNAGGVSRYKDGQWKTFFPMHGLADYWIYSFAQQKNNDFWIGTWAGVNKVDGKTGKFSTYVKELVNEWVYGITVDALDRVWFGTEGGVSMHDGKRWVSWTHKDGLGAPNADNLPHSTNTGLGTRSRHDLSVGADGPATYNPNYVFSILSAADGSIWAGTWGGGAARWDGKAWRNLTMQDGLAGNIVYSLAQGADGVLWFGTDKGVSRYDGKAFQTIGMADGLLERHVYALAVAPNGDVWAGTRKGVVRIAR